MIKGSFIADSNYQYLCIGNFFINGLTDTLHYFNYQAYQSYYFVDDVCVSVDSNTCFTSVGLPYIFGNKTQPKIFPNPSNDLLSITTGNEPVYQITIIDYRGKIIKKINDYYWKDDLIQINVEELTSGIYLAIFNHKKYSTQVKFIINH